MSQVSVSIVVPVYNSVKYLAECLDSILGQTLRDIEVLCVDDGSIDGCESVLSAYAGKDSRVRVIRQGNAGAGVARNRALDEARGEYIAFMDADDKYPDSNVLFKLCRDARAAQALMCGGALLGVDEPWAVGCSPARFVAAKDWPYNYGFTRYLYSRKLFADGKLKFPSLRLYEDPVFFIRALARAGGFYGVEYPTYSYRVGYKRANYSASHYLRLRQLLKGLDIAMKEARRFGLKLIYERIRLYVHGEELAEMAFPVRHRSIEVWFRYSKLLRRKPL